MFCLFLFFVEILFVVLTLVVSDPTVCYYAMLYVLQQTIRPAGGAVMYFTLQ
jgi:hypothetical protein